MDSSDLRRIIPGAAYDALLAERDQLRTRVEELEKENARLLAELSADTGHSHRCKRCNLNYTPGKNESEDCPECEHDGT